MLVEVSLDARAIITITWRAAIKPIKAHAGLVESYTVSHAPARSRLSGSRELALRPSDDDRVAHVNLHSLDPEEDRIQMPRLREINADVIAVFIDAGS